MEQKRTARYQSNRIFHLPIDRISPNPRQPRRHFAEQPMRELADSIRQHGVLQPLTLLALVENLQRCDLHYMEEAAAISRLISAYGMSQEEAARRLGRSQSAVANKLRLLRLSPACVELLRQFELTERHARALLRLEDEEARVAALRHIGERRLNVAASDEYIESLLQKRPKGGGRKPVFVIKDVRLFLNSVNRGMETIRRAGVDARCDKQESDDEITITIQIPKKKAAG